MTEWHQQTMVWDVIRAHWAPHPPRVFHPSGDFVSFHPVSRFNAFAHVVEQTEPGGPLETARTHNRDRNER